MLRRRSKLSILFTDTHAPFITSLVFVIMPTMYANVFSLHDTLLLWDEILSPSCKVMFQHVVRIMVQNILFHKNMFLHKPVDKSMMLFQLDESVCPGLFITVYLQILYYISCPSMRRKGWSRGKLQRMTFMLYFSGIKNTANDIKDCSESSQCVTDRGTWIL